MSALGKVGAAAAIAAAGAAVWGVGIERHLYTVRHQTIRVLPENAGPIRVLHISDPHMAPWQQRKQRWISHLASLRPDLIIHTGDNLGHPHGLDGVKRAYDSFAGIPAVYVHGSNDLWAPAPRNPLLYLAGSTRGAAKADRLDTDALDSYLQDDLGWVQLNNATTELTIKGQPLRLFGVNDAHHDLHDLGVLAEQVVDQEFEGVGLGVTHAPYREVLDAFVDFGADAIFAGHTHGGQVRVPFYGALVTNCDLPPKQASGLSDWTHLGRTVPLTVSAGIGHAIYSPVRFACPPEVTLVTLASAFQS